MSTKSKVSEGFKEPVMTPLSKDKIAEFLKKDLNIAISCLDAIYRDADLLDAMAEFMHGRYENARNKAELEKQTKLQV